MKIRYLAAGFTLLMIISILCLLVRTPGEKPAAYDMVYYNEQLKQIEEEAAAGAGRETLETKHLCSLLFLTDENYESRLNDAYRQGKLVTDMTVAGKPVGKVVFSSGNDSYRQWSNQIQTIIVTIWGVVLGAGYLLLAAVYIWFIRPFGKLKRFASEVARGNLDIPLPMERHNFFGAFTESFDLMREELKIAREKEYRVNISKKELVAELSHDIKTPVAAIKATCEVMEVVETSPETLKKVSIIAAKADTIEQLVNNMFQAALEELEILKFHVQEEGTPCIMEMFGELKYYGEICLENHIPECLVYMDRLRLEQVINNIINNSFKYAKTPVRVRFEPEDGGIRIFIRDHGPGIREDELALVTEKFYRGSNAGAQSGSGLGLYLARVFMEQMRGGIECFNEDGFTVVLFLRKAA